MSNQIDLSQRLELCDSAGNILGVFLTAKDAQELIAGRDQLREEANRLRAEVAELRHALEQAQRDKATIMAERDLYLEHLEMFWAEVIAEADKNGNDFGEFIAELERALNSNSPSALVSNDEKIEPDMVLDTENNSPKFDEGVSNL